MQTIDLGARTDRGRKREENEDTVLVRSRQGDGAGQPPAHLLAVADGMGGAAGGQTASREAARALEEAFDQGQAANPGALLREAFKAANARVRRMARAEPRLQGMATTLLAAIVTGGEAWIGNVGDSRAYLVRGGEARRLTRDHSWVAERVLAGEMTAEEAAASPTRNVITRAIGADDSVRVDISGPVELQAGDVLLLCSDGLHGVASDAEIAAACSRVPPAEVVEELVDLANSRGGPDNISVAAGLVQGAASDTAAFRVRRRGLWARPALAVVALAGFLFIAGGVTGALVMTGAADIPASIPGASVLGVGDDSDKPERPRLTPTATPVPTLAPAAGVVEQETPAPTRWSTGGSAATPKPEPSATSDAGPPASPSATASPTPTAPPTLVPTPLVCHTLTIDVLHGEDWPRHPVKKAPLPNCSAENDKYLRGTTVTLTADAPPGCDVTWKDAGVTEDGKRHEVKMDKDRVVTVWCKQDATESGDGHRDGGSRQDAF